MKPGKITKDSKICGHCNWVKSIDGSWRCTNPDHIFYESTVRYDDPSCAYFESVYPGRSYVREKDKTDYPEITVADVIVVSDEPAEEIPHDEEVVSELPASARSISVSEDVEQIGKDIIVGRKEVGYKDGKNVISVIINAIRVCINMPQGTVKALMACFVILLIATVIYACDARYSIV